MFKNTAIYCAETRSSFTMVDVSAISRKTIFFEACLGLHWSHVLLFTIFSTNDVIRSLADRRAHARDAFYVISWSVFAIENKKFLNCLSMSQWVVSHISNNRTIKNNLDLVNCIEMLKMGSTSWRCRRFFIWCRYRSRFRNHSTFPIQRNFAALHAKHLLDFGKKRCLVGNLYNA